MLRYPALVTPGSTDRISSTLDFTAAWYELSGATPPGTLNGEPAILANGKPLAGIRNVPVFSDVFIDRAAYLEIDGSLFKLWRDLNAVETKSRGDHLKTNE